jgi:hypothetical protein
MRKKSLALFVSVSFMGAAALAQAPDAEVRESTDPARIAEVEQRAAEIMAGTQRDQQQPTSGEPQTSGAPTAARAGADQATAEIRESTDPATIAEVEQRAAEIIANQQAQQQRR